MQMIWLGFIYGLCVIKSVKFESNSKYKWIMLIDYRMPWLRARVVGLHCCIVAWLIVHFMWCQYRPQQSTVYIVYSWLSVTMLSTILFASLPPGRGRYNIRLPCINGRQNYRLAPSLTPYSQRTMCFIGTLWVNRLTRLRYDRKQWIWSHINSPQNALGCVDSDYRTGPLSAGTVDYRKFVNLPIQNRTMRRPRSFVVE